MAQGAYVSLKGDMQDWPPTGQTHNTHNKWGQQALTAAQLVSMLTSVDISAVKFMDIFDVRAELFFLHSPMIILVN